MVPQHSDSLSAWRCKVQGPHEDSSQSMPHPGLCHCSCPSATQHWDRRPLEASGCQPAHGEPPHRLPNGDSGPGLTPGLCRGTRTAESCRVSAKHWSMKGVLGASLVRSLQTSWAEESPGLGEGRRTGGDPVRPPAQESSPHLGVKIPGKRKAERKACPMD